MVFVLRDKNITVSVNFFFGSIKKDDNICTTNYMSYVVLRATVLSNKEFSMSQVQKFLIYMNTVGWVDIIRFRLDTSLVHDTDAV